MNALKKEINMVVSFLITFFVTILVFGHYLIIFQDKKVIGLLLFGFVLATIILSIAEKKIPEKIWKEIVIISIVPVLVILTSVLFHADKFDFYTSVISWFSLFFFCLFFIILEFAIKAAKQIQLKKISHFLFEHKLMIIFLLIIAIIRLPYLDLLPRWDSGEYYYRFSESVSYFQFHSLNEFANLFTLCGHPTLAFSLVYMTGEMIAPMKVIGVSVTNLLITLIAIWCIYKIFLKIIKGITPVKAAIYTLILSMAPLFYSTTMYFNPDYTYTIFFIFVIYSFIYERPLLAGMSSILCFQTKETGLVLVGGLVVGIFVQHFLNRKTKAFFSALFTDLRLYCTLVATLLQLIYTKRIGGVSRWSQGDEGKTGLKWDNNGSDCFGLNIDFISTKLKQQFILNFNWIVILIIIICIVVLSVYRKRDKLQPSNHDICGIVGGFVAFVLFSGLYITASLARYNVVGDVLLYIIMFYLIAITEQTVFKKRSKLLSIMGYLFASIFFILIVVQCFYTIDPVTRIAFKKLDAGNTDLYYVGKNIPVDDMYYGDYLIYNTQFTYIDKAYDVMLNNVSYEPDQYDLILADSNGSFLTGNVAMYYLNWDRKQKKRVFYSNENTIGIQDYYDANMLTDEQLETYKMKQKAILVYNPYLIHIDIDMILDKLSKYYNISKQKSADTCQGSIQYYELIKK